MVSPYAASTSDSFAQRLGPSQVLVAGTQPLEAHVPRALISQLAQLKEAQVGAIVLDVADSALLLRIRRGRADQALRDIEGYEPLLDKPGYLELAIAAQQQGITVVGYDPILNSLFDQWSDDVTTPAQGAETLQRMWEKTNVFITNAVVKVLRPSSKVVVATTNERLDTQKSHYTPGLDRHLQGRSLPVSTLPAEPAAGLLTDITGFRDARDLSDALGRDRSLFDADRCRIVGNWHLQHRGNYEAAAAYRDGVALGDASQLLDLAVVDIRTLDFASAQAHAQEAAAFGVEGAAELAEAYGTQLRLGPPAGAGEATL